MASVYRASHVSLHVRKSNKAALGLYRDTLGFTDTGIEKKYCESMSMFFLSIRALLINTRKMRMERMHMR